MAPLNFLVFCSLQFLLFSSVLAEKVVLDLHADQTKNWLDVSCLYNDDYTDFWAYGYPVTLIGDDDVYPTKRGFWTAGLAQRCEMHYYLGVGMPFAKTITLGMYLKGTPQVLIASKYSLLDEEYTTEVGSISDKDGNGWFEHTIVLPEDRAMVFNFTLISMGDDLLLLDKITFDFGDDVTTPTEPTPTTTSLPIRDDIVTLDTDKDYSVLWTEDCHYVDDFNYFWAYGCAEVTPQEDDSLVGYWNPCSSNYTSCNLRFTASPSVLPAVPSSITIRSYVDGNARINVTARNNQDGVCEEGCSVMGVISGTEGTWLEVTIPVNVSLSVSNYSINIELIPSEDSVVLLEKVVLFPGTVVTTPNPGSTSSDGGSTSSDGGSTSSGGSNPTGGSTSPTSATTERSSAVTIAKMEWHVITSILIAFKFVFL